jgi:hypothetical protein
MTAPAKVPTVLKPAKVPATRKLSVPDLRPFNAFVRKCDEALESYNELGKLMRNLAPAYELRESFEIESERDDYKQQVAECREGLARFDPEHRYNEDHDLDVDYIADRLGVMIATIPNVNPHAPEGFAPLLVANVQAFEELDALVLESACREIEQTMKFTPAVAELLAALRKHQALWMQRRRAINWLEDRCDLTIASLRKGEAKARENKIAEQRRELMSLEHMLIDARKREAELEAKRREAKAKLFVLEYEDAEVLDQQWPAASIRSNLH